MEKRGGIVNKTMKIIGGYVVKKRIIIALLVLTMAILSACGEEHISPSPSSIAPTLVKGAYYDENYIPGVPMLFLAMYSSPRAAVSEQSVPGRADAPLENPYEKSVPRVTWALYNEKFELVLNDIHYANPVCEDKDGDEIAETFYGYYVQQDDFSFFLRADGTSNSDLNDVDGIYEIIDGTSVIYRFDDKNESFIYGLYDLVEERFVQPMRKNYAYFMMTIDGEKQFAGYQINGSPITTYTIYDTKGKAVQETVDPYAGQEEEYLQYGYRADDVTKTLIDPTTDEVVFTLLPEYEYMSIPGKGYVLAERNMGTEEEPNYQQMLFRIEKGYPNGKPMGEYEQSSIMVLSDGYYLARRWDDEQLSTLYTPEGKKVFAAKTIQESTYMSYLYVDTGYCFGFVDYTGRWMYRETSRHTLGD